MTNPNGYDFKIGDYGFRLATDTDHKYQRYTEPYSTQKIDNSKEAGEQSLNALPWVKSQDSFHGGAGQINLSGNISDYEYQQEQINYLRFSESEGVDVWTPGKVTQLKNVTKLDVSSTTTDDITDTVFGVVPGSTVPPASAIMFGTSAGLFAITWYYNSDMTCYQASLTGDFTGSYSVQSLATNPTRTELFVYLTTTDGSYIVRNSSFVAGIGTTTTTLASQVSFGLSPSMEYVKGRLIVVGDQSVYEVDAYADSAITALPDALYTLPGTAYFSDVSISEYSGGFYVGYNQTILGDQAAVTSEILRFTVSNDSPPTIVYDGTVAKLPVGELLTDMVVYLDSFLILTTTAGVRVCNIDSDGSVTIGPLSHESNTYTGIFCLDRFAYCSYVGEGDEGDVRVRRFDLSMPIASDGSLANAADLSFAGSDPPKWIGYMPTGYLSEVDDVLTTSPRLVWHDGSSNFYIQGSGVADTSWLKTSRIRFDTSIPKLWTGGIIIGDPEADVTVEVEGSDGNSYACTYDTTENTFAVSTSPTLTWVQLKISLSDTATTTLYQYSINGYPQPKRQSIIICSALCYVSEEDRWGNKRSETDDPRTRWNNVKTLENDGGQYVFTEYTNSGTETCNVVIDQLQFEATSPPQKSDDFGGIITFKLRVVE